MCCGTTHIGAHHMPVSFTVVLGAWSSCTYVTNTYTYVTLL